MSKEAVKSKRKLSERQYREFARKVGQKIDYNRKMRVLKKNFNLGDEAIQNEIAAYYNQANLANVNNSGNPIWLVLTYLQYKEQDYSDTTIEGMIAAEILPTHERSFLRFSDRNKLTKRIRKNYLKHDGTALDVQAEIISEIYQKEVTIEDLVEFILSHPNGPETYTNPLQQKKAHLAANFKTITGFNLTESFVCLFQQDFLQNALDIDFKDVPF